MKFELNETLCKDPEHRMTYTRQFLLSLEGICDVDDKGNVVIPFQQVHTFYEELRRCQELLKV